ncbi:hypothetical protein DSL72_004983 [Monilinia vaccinii-corymbosi]|uniref:Uncharacterized protein n=1 Tax=Monilinia vaccinii-corymbosi TaxID=61207 RepID=A0A8A3PEB5_9HELO|nr:hypothetical protein DSL72_004983 [Monilinia vaccinii-corymbosi]
MKYSHLSSAILLVCISTTTPVPVSRSATNQTYTSRAISTISAGNPIDFNSQHYNPVAGVSYRKRSEYFRYSSTTHVVYNYPHPDSRPIQTHSATINPTSALTSPSKGHTVRHSPPASPSRSPTGSINSGNKARLD